MPYPRSKLLPYDCGIDGRGRIGALSEYQITANEHNIWLWIKRHDVSKGAVELGGICGAGI